MRWDDLRVFLAVARAGSLAGGARELAINHSTAWRRLGGLEEEVGAQLFERGAGGYVLTAAGEAMLPHAEQVEASVFALQRAVHGRDRSLEGIVRVTAPDSMMTVLTPMFTAFSEAHAGIHLELLVGDRFFDLERREADVAIRPGLQPPEHLHGRRVATVAWTRYAPKRVPKRKRARLPWLVYGDDLARLAAVGWQRERHAQESARFTVNTVPAMARLLGATDSQGLLPCFVGDPDDGLARLDAPIAEAASALWLLHHADLRRNARVKAFENHAWRWLRRLRPLFEGQA